MNFVIGLLLGFLLCIGTTLICIKIGDWRK